MGKFTHVVAKLLRSVYCLDKWEMSYSVVGSLAWTENIKKILNANIAFFTTECSELSHADQKISDAFAHISFRFSYTGISSEKG